MGAFRVSSTLTSKKPDQKDVNDALVNLILPAHLHLIRRSIVPLPGVDIALDETPSIRFIPAPLGQHHAVWTGPTSAINEQLEVSCDHIHLPVSTWPLT